MMKAMPLRFESATGRLPAVRVLASAYRSCVERKHRWSMQVEQRSKASTVRRTRQSIRWHRGVSVLIWIVLSAVAATAQQRAGSSSDTIVTRGSRDLNGTVAVNERVVTHRAQTDDGEQVVVETFSRSIEAGHLALSRRVRRVTTATGDETQTVEVTEERNPAAPSEPLRVVRRSVTTMRRSGAESVVTERQVLELDLNGRFVPVFTQTERTSRN